MVNAGIVAKRFGASLTAFGLAAGAALALAGVVRADDDDDYYGPANEIVVSPDTYADPATNWVPWADGGNTASAPQVDNTVQQSR